MQQSFLAKKVADAWPPETWRDVTVLVAVSGGADSVALVRALHELRARGEGKLAIAHFNHRLRGAESDADQAFVEQLARELDLTVLVGAADRSVGSAKSEGAPASSEESLREQRYEFLVRTAKELGARYVATAHTADDQVETVLHNILRGTGLTGLAGIPRTRQLSESAALIRPLLEVTRGEVLDYLQSLGQPYREDSSNKQLHYTRNRIRHELLPLLERQFNPHVREAIARLSHLAGEANEWIAAQVTSWADKNVRSVAGGFELELEEPETPNDPLLRELLMHLWRRQAWPLQDMSYEKWDELAAMARTAELDNEGEQRIFPGNIRAKKKGGVLQLTRPTDAK